MSYEASDVLYQAIIQRKVFVEAPLEADEVEIMKLAVSKYNQFPVEDLQISLEDIALVQQCDEDHFYDHVNHGRRF